MNTIKFDLWTMLQYYILGHLKIESNNTSLIPYGPYVCEYVCVCVDRRMSNISNKNKNERKRMAKKKKRVSRDRLGIRTLICSRR
jgi:hypothetical protein